MDPGDGDEGRRNVHVCLGPLQHDDEYELQQWTRRDGRGGVRENTTTEAEITIHIDHLFWDTLGSEEASLRFDALAAASGDDKEISLEDLTTQKLSDLKGLDGIPLVDAEGNPIIYNPGSVPLAAQDLQSYMLASSASMGHLNGEGLCTIGAL